MMSDAPLYPLRREGVDVWCYNLFVCLRRLGHHVPLLNRILADMRLSSGPDELDLEIGKGGSSTRQQGMCGEVLDPSQLQHLQIVVDTQRTGRLSRNTLSSSSPFFTISRADSAARVVRWRCTMAGWSCSLPKRYIEPVVVPVCHQHQHDPKVEVNSLSRSTRSNSKVRRVSRSAGRSTSAMLRVYCSGEPRRRRSKVKRERIKA